LHRLHYGDAVWRLKKIHVTGLVPATWTSMSAGSGFFADPHALDVQTLCQFRAEVLSPKKQEISRCN
jgi:hypothetical protein